MIELRHITKRFPGVLANDDVSLTVAGGEIHAVLGENGAGKSTLMQTLYGFHAMDAGEIRIEGQRVEIASPADAIALGIGMVHQDFMLVPTFTVAENTVLGMRSSALLHLQQVEGRLREISAQHQLAVDPEALPGALPIGVQQRVEILKLLYRDARILILDEPTAVLTAPEKDRLFAVLRGLRAEGRSIILVTHKLQEILDIADRVTVMRDGRVVGSVDTQETTALELARMMVGRDVNLNVNRSAMPQGKCALRVEDLRVRDHRGRLVVDGVSLEVAKHEILGIAGVDGNGQSQLAEALLHLRPVESGRVMLTGEAITRFSVAEHRRRGMSYVPADRRGVSSVAEMSIAENAMLGSIRARTRRGLLDWARIRSQAEMLMQRFGVRAASVDTAVSKLSGGNLQKVILGRELLSAPKVLIVEQPTRGLDVGAIEAVWAELLLAREQGMGILLISAELEELMNLADRIAVMFEGRIVGVVDPKAVTTEEIGSLMAGASLERGVTV